MAYYQAFNSNTNLEKIYIYKYVYIITHRMFRLRRTLFCVSRETASVKREVSVLSHYSNQLHKVKTISHKSDQLAYLEA